ncbi:MAG: cytochrome-c oxidase, cbb3-type subunit III [Pseudomonadota bacterium]
MSDHDKPDIDETSGVETTGHEWDGIKELNNPLPKWWLNLFYITVVWGIGFTIFFPAWPMITKATEGILGYSTRAEHAEIMAEVKRGQAVYTDQIAAKPLEDVVATSDLLEFARAGGAAAFRTNCSQCHGAGAAGGQGYPNLLDDDWIWGGTLEEIEHTIRHGIRVVDAEGFGVGETRESEMPAFGRDELLETEEIAQVVEHVLRISGQQHDAALATPGATVFEDNCSACHAEDGRGLREIGAPNLTDAIWLYGGDRETLTTTLNQGRAGAMPAWGERLDEATVKMLAIYVHSLGGGEAAETELSAAE